MATRSPAGSVAAAEAVVASRVRKAARIGRVSGCPDRASAPGWIVIVWNVPGTHRSCGAIVRMVPEASQARTTGVGGSTVTAAATDTGSMGTLNPMLTGSVRARLVENVVVNAAWVSGRIGVGTVATVGAGRPAVKIPIPMMSASARTRPDRMRTERRTNAPR